MTPVSNQQERGATSLPSSRETSLGHNTPVLAKEELDRALRALEMPFDPNLIQWRITEWSDERTRGLMMPYADPRAYTERLNCLINPDSWRRKERTHVTGA